MKSRLFALAALFVLGVVSSNFAQASGGCAAPAGPTCAAPSAGGCGCGNTCKPRCGLKGAHGCCLHASKCSSPCGSGNCGSGHCGSGHCGSGHCGNGACQDGLCGNGDCDGCGNGCCRGCHKCCRGLSCIDGTDPYFNCGCSGSYKFPVPPLYTYHWPGMYSAVRMTDYHSPWRFPPIKPYTEEPTYQRVGASVGDEYVSVTGSTSAIAPTGKVESVSSRLSRLGQ